RQSTRAPQLLSTPRRSRERRVRPRARLLRQLLQRLRAPGGPRHGHLAAFVGALVCEELAERQQREAHPKAIDRASGLLLTQECLRQSSKALDFVGFPYECTIEHAPRGGRVPFLERRIRQAHEAKQRPKGCLFRLPVDGGVRKGCADGDKIVKLTASFLA